MSNFYTQVKELMADDEIKIRKSLISSKHDELIAEIFDWYNSPTDENIFEIYVQNIESIEENDLLPFLEFILYNCEQIPNSKQFVDLIQLFKCIKT